MLNHKPNLNLSFMPSVTIKHHLWNYLCLLLITLTLINPLPVNSQEENYEATPSTEVNETESIEEENTVRQVNQTESLLSIQGGEKLMDEARVAINEENYDLAANKLRQARRIFNQLSNFYIQLAESFSGIDNRIAESQRVGALQTAALRDETTYQLALVHRAQNQPELAVPLLIQIIRSQNPTSELGKKSYQQLYEIGFVETPFENSSN
jgi:thioredoxin-like negative regulator of GroEL